MSSKLQCQLALHVLELFASLSFLLDFLPTSPTAPTPSVHPSDSLKALLSLVNQAYYSPGWCVAAAAYMATVSWFRTFILSPPSICMYLPYFPVFFQLFQIDINKSKCFLKNDKRPVTKPTSHATYLAQHVKFQNENSPPPSFEFFSHHLHKS